MDDKPRRTVHREVHPTGKGKKPVKKTVPTQRRAIRNPEQPRTTAKTAQRQRERVEERTAMKIKERRVSPTPVKRRRTPARPEVYAEREKPKRTVPPGTTVRKTDAQRRREGFEKMRRRKRTLLVGVSLFVVALLVLGVTFAANVLFEVKTVTVTGNTRYNAGDIQTAAGIAEGDNLLFLPEGKAVAAVDGLFPWIGSVKIVRHFPDTVEIQVEDAVPSCVFASQGWYLLVSDTGRILERQMMLPGGYFCVRGLELVSYEPGDTVEIVDVTAANAYREIAAVLQEQGVTRVDLLDLTDVYDISLLYDGRITMKLGSPTDLAYKIRFGMKIVAADGEDGLSSTDRGVLDLSLTRDNNKAYFAPEAIVSQPETSSGQEGGASSAEDGGGEDASSSSDEDDTVTSGEE